MARVYADVNANMPRSYWDYDSVNIAWGALESYEVVRKIGTDLCARRATGSFLGGARLTDEQGVESTRRSSRASTSSTTKNA